MGILLYDNPASSNAMKVRFLLAELGLEYERKHVPLARPRPDWYLARYPFGTIPFLEDGDFELGESNAILRYLCNREGRADLYPSEPAARAAVDWALDAWSTQFRGALFPAELIGLMHGDWEQGGSRAEDADQAKLAGGDRRRAAEVDIMERFVAANGTVVGSFTIADSPSPRCCGAGTACRSTSPPWPKVALLRDTVTARPAFAAMGPRA